MLYLFPLVVLLSGSRLLPYIVVLRLGLGALILGVIVPNLNLFQSPAPATPESRKEQLLVSYPDTGSRFHNSAGSIDYSQPELPG